MNYYCEIIILVIFILLLFYFRHKKLITQHFTISSSKPKIIIQNKTQMLWINQEMKNIETNVSDFTTSFLSAETPSYTNRSINSDMDFYQGFYFKLGDNVSNLKIGLHNGKLLDFQNPISDIDFAFSFLEGNKLQITEKYNPYIENALPKGKPNIIDIDYCQNKNKTLCLETKNTIQYQPEYGFAILIHENMINYCLLNINPQTRKPESALLIHQSTNKFTYPLYPLILNTEKRNKFQEFKWCSSQVVPPPTEYSVELLNPVKYGLLAEPPQESLNRYAPQPSQTDLNPSGPAPAPEIPLFPWDRKIEILHAILYRPNKMLNIFVKAQNINSLFLERLYGVNILLSIPKKNKNLVIPYIPLISDNNLTLDENSVINMEVYIGDHLSYFYQKDIQVKVVLRLGEFTSQENIVSNSFILKY